MRPTCCRSGRDCVTVRALSRPTALDDRVDDARVRLVRHEHVDLGALDAGTLQRVRGGLDAGAHGAPEHFLAVHLDVLFARRDEQDVCGRAVAADDRSRARRSPGRTGPSRPRPHRRRRGSRVPRSIGSTIVCSVSAPTIERGACAAGLASRASAITTEYTKPEHAATRSNAPHCKPRLSCTNAEVAGQLLRGSDRGDDEQVDQLGVDPESLIASAHAAVASVRRGLVVGPAMRRS